jgi:hypothetical protein
MGTIESSVKIPDKIMICDTDVDQSFLIFLLDQK